MGGGPLQRSFMIFSPAWNLITDASHKTAGGFVILFLVFQEQHDQSAVEQKNLILFLFGRVFNQRAAFWGHGVEWIRFCSVAV